MAVYAAGNPFVFSPGEQVLRDIAVGLEGIHGIHKVCLISVKLALYNLLQGRFLLLAVTQKIDTG